MNGKQSLPEGIRGESIVFAERSSVRATISKTSSAGPHVIKAGRRTHHDCDRTTPSCSDLGGVRSLERQERAQKILSGGRTKVYTCSYMYFTIYYAAKITVNLNHDGDPSYTRQSLSSAGACVQTADESRVLRALYGSESGPDVEIRLVSEHSR
ncbi:hypothetical protein WMY93_032498 [Mugilogobius chulae]|uniref:Uncharacterized protein n=1 Tax=Mugilogobius chulae TaxID=88201 RepID=A0AAW0MJD1_9GOBI